MRCCCRMLKRMITCLLILVVMVMIIIGLRLLYNYVTDNVHTVISGKIYRTAQLDHAGLKKYTKQFQLKTIINLRGAWPTNHWYRVESNFAKKNYLHYYSIQFSAYRLPAKNKIRELVRVLQTAPKPLAFHCEGGADRTGMASIISLILFNQHPTMMQLKREASWYYNAVSGYTVGYQVLRNYLAWLKLHHDKQSSKKLFFEWLHSSAKMKPYHGWFLVY